MDWTTVVAAGVGGAIGLSGDLLGRMGARRQAARQRKEALEDAEIAYRRGRDEELDRESRQEARLAIHRIFETFTRNPVSVIAPNDRRTIQSAQNILHELSYQQLHIPDLDLRRKLNHSIDMLDLAIGASPPAGYSIAEVVFVIRNNCRDWLGAWARGEEIPTPTEDWQDLLNALGEAIEQWHQQLAGRGSKIHPRKIDDY